jgi:HD superfamily phosphohydrolase
MFNRARKIMWAIAHKLSSNREAQTFEAKHSSKRPQEGSMTLEANFYETLAKKYATATKGDAAWQEENEKVRSVLASLAESLSPRYTIETPINIGGTAIVLKIQDCNLGIPRALKFPRPLQGKEILLKRIIESEIARLIECTHPNIVSVYDKGEVISQEHTWPYYVMEYLEGARDAKEWMEENKPDFHNLISLLQQTADGLIFLHDRGTVHCDIKLENILVLPNGQAKISDLGSARLLDPDNNQETMLTFTRDFAHPTLRGMLTGTAQTDPNRVSAKLPRSQLDPVFDLYALGKNVLRILKCYDVAEHNLLPQYERRYLSLMGSRMLDGRVSADTNSTGLPDSIFAEIKYKNSIEVRLDLKKATGEYNLCRTIPELDLHFPRTIQASLPYSTPLTDRVGNFLASSYLRRLGGITQLGLITQIYPTATHTRLEHTLGCFGNVARYIDALWHDSVNPFFKQVFTEHDVNTALLSALCHDIGQYPLAHDLEEADSDLFSHQQIGQRILLNCVDSDSVALRRLMHDEWQVTPEEVVDLLSTRLSDLAKPLKLRFLSSLIDGPLDADKLDYLIRDSLNLNLPYGSSIDVDRLLKCLTVAFKQQGDGTFIALGIHEKGKIPAEGLAFARYAMFGTVYWHHTSRSTKAMLHRAVWETIPTSDKRLREYKDFSEALWSEIVREGRVGVKTSSDDYLFVENVHSVLPTETPQLAVSDYKMLCWIYQHSNARGRYLIESISRRQLFKRLLVISARKNQPLWDRLLRVKKEATAKDLIKFQDSFQQSVVHLLDGLEPEKRMTTILEKNKTDEIVGRHDRGEILFLVDIPGDRRGSATDLYFLPEHRIYGPITSQQENGEIEDSPVWNSLSTQFAASVGKIRVFCAPDIVATCTEGLLRPAIEGALEAAAASITR